MKPLFGVVAWFFLSTGVLLTTAAVYQFYFRANLPQSFSAQLPKIAAPSETEKSTTSQVSYNSGMVQGVSTIIEAEDGRAIILASFLERYNSPLQPYDYFGKKLVEIADRHGIDFRLLPAIAMQESNLCNRIPPGTFNCLGFGIHERGTLGFDNYEAGFERAARELKANYIDEGRTTPQQIMKKYTPSSNGSWAESVNQWMAEMRYNDRAAGIASEADANVLEFAVK